MLKEATATNAAAAAHVMHIMPTAVPCRSPTSRETSRDHYRVTATLGSVGIRMRIAGTITLHKSAGNYYLTIPMRL